MATVAKRRAHHRAERASSSLVMHNVVVAGRRTSVRLEPVMWDALVDIARSEARTVHDIVTAVDRRRSESTLTAAIRVYIVDFYRTAALRRTLPPGRRAISAPTSGARH